MFGSTLREPAIHACEADLLVLGCRDLGDILRRSRVDPQLSHTRLLLSAVSWRGWYRSCDLAISTAPAYERDVSFDEGSYDMNNDTCKTKAVVNSPSTSTSTLLN